MGIKRLNITGNKYGYVTVLEFVGMGVDHNKGKSLWKCQCECGKVFVVAGTQLTRGKSKSCGCKKAKFKVKDELSFLNSKEKLLITEDGYFEFIKDLIAVCIQDYKNYLKIQFGLIRSKENYLQNGADAERFLKSEYFQYLCLGYIDSSRLLQMAEEEVNKSIKRSKRSKRKCQIS